jgi:3-methyladenine DNA glycosylase AlkC
MAEPLKNHFGADIPKKIAGMIHAAHPSFDVDSFLREALTGYEPLALLPRGWQIARALRRHLPQDYARAADVLLASLGPKLTSTESFGMAPFLYLPHVLFVAEFGLDHFEISMRAQHELTQRFTAEFSIRPYLERHTEATLARMETWARDPSPHVRRLVSEGARPRLPWASRLRRFQADPRPVLALLELLKDDPELYVRRSVANNLNDIGKDHPALLAETARRWQRGASEERRWLIRHALRSAVKRSEAGALAVLGFGGAAQVSIDNARIEPPRVKTGGAVSISFSVRNTSAASARVLVDFRVFFVKAGGKPRPKVFKLKTLSLAPGETATLGKTLSLKQMTTRQHHPGRHAVEVLLNGRAAPLGAFEVV